MSGFDGGLSSRHLKATLCGLSETASNLSKLFVTIKAMKENLSNLKCLRKYGYQIKESGW
jgi:hypothetical protein